MNTKITILQIQSLLKSSGLIALFILIPNSLFIFTSIFLGIGRPYINIDYALAMILIVMPHKISVIFGVLLFIIFAVIDTLYLVNQIFPLPRLLDIFYLIKVAHLASYQFTLLIFAAVIALIISLLGSTYISTKQTKLTALLALNILLTIYMLHICIPQNDTNKFYRVTTRYLVNSQTTDFTNKRVHNLLLNANSSGEAFSPATFAGISERFYRIEPYPAHLNSKLLLIINESWGVPHNKNIQNTILAPIYQLATNNLEQGVLAFSGPTVSGELRELCKLQQNHFNFAEISQGLEHCLPNQLKALGYQTAAMHGAVSLMYDRKYWYPKAGFEQTTFFENRVWPSRCFSFPGACDFDLKEELPKFFYGSEKKFFYWLSLNTHSLYDLRDLKIDIFNCTEFDIKQDTESCRNLKLQAQFIYGIAEVLKKPEMKGVEVIIVGDHTPIIFNGEEKQRNFVENKVPWIHFKIKES